MQIMITGKVRIFKRQGERLFRTSAYVRDVPVAIGEPVRLRLGRGSFARRVTAYPAEIQSNQTHYLLEKEIKAFLPS